MLKCAAQVRCYAYEPPGALVDEALAARMRPFCVCSVLCDDLVPRLGLRQLFDLRDNAVDALVRCKVPKWKAISSATVPNPKTDALFVDQNDPTLADECASLSTAAISLLRNEATVATALKKLCLPGSVIHLAIRKDGPDVCGRITRACPGLGPFLPGPRFGSRLRRAWRVDAFRTHHDHFGDIAVSGSMAIDHFPWRIDRALKATAPRRTQPATQHRATWVPEPRALATPTSKPHPGADML